MIFTPPDTLPLRSAILLAVSLWLPAALISSAPSAIAAGTPDATSAERAPARNRDPAEVAAGYYRSGIKQKEKAWKNEARAEDTDDPKKRQRYLDRAQTNYNKAIVKLGAAVKVYPQYYEAASELGYALRKTGDYRKAVGAYNYALGIKADFHPAVEYRAEAYLALGFTDQVKDAYMVLFRADPTLAAQLMNAMEEWLASQGEASESVTAFADWVVERKDLAEISAELSANTTRQW